MPVLPSTPESKAKLNRIFGNGLVVFGQKRPDSSKPNSPTTPEPAKLPDLQNLPEDPVIRPSLISNGVPRQFWPEGVITLKQAESLILKYGEHPPLKESSED